MFIVKYQVNGFPGIHEAGPYITKEIADRHRDDIAGYTGVHSVQIDEVPVPAPKSSWERLLEDE
jgi:hypothetical protein